MFSLEVVLQTPYSASVSGENGKSLALIMYIMNPVVLNFFLSSYLAVRASVLK